MEIKLKIEIENAEQIIENLKEASKKANQVIALTEEINELVSSIEKMKIRPETRGKNDISKIEIKMVEMNEQKRESLLEKLQKEIGVSGYIVRGE